MDLLRWWRFLQAVDVSWNRATRREARDFSCWIQETVKPRKIKAQGPRAVRGAGAANPVTGKPSTGSGYAPATVVHSETVLRRFYDVHRDAGTGLPHALVGAPLGERGAVPGVGAAVADPVDRGGLARLHAGVDGGGMRRGVVGVGHLSGGGQGGQSAHGHADVGDHRRHRLGVADDCRVVACAVDDGGAHPRPAPLEVVAVGARGLGARPPRHPHRDRLRDRRLAGTGLGHRLLLRVGRRPCRPTLYSGWRRSASRSPQEWQVEAAGAGVTPGGGTREGMVVAWLGGRIRSIPVIPARR
ncbi:hypothetical protein QMZ92_33410 [Streptomyces sp. HNM0645]|nr:hypothetical protein [Streptomyces sp. HNM0645]MDI9889108.1 hypothetical protein [Streptomyces sp. HNM0645]